MTAKMENTLLSVRNDFITKHERDGSTTQVCEYERALHKFGDTRWYQTDFSLRTKTKNGKIIRVYISVEEEGGED